MKKPRERIPQPDVLAWLKSNHPMLHVTCEIDRAWIWITESLKPPHHNCKCEACENLAAVRRSLADYGFVFARRHLHQLPSGKLGTWGHSCLKPLPFRRKGKPEKTETEDRTEDFDGELSRAIEFLSAVP